MTPLPRGFPYLFLTYNRIGGKDSLAGSPLPETARATPGGFDAWLAPNQRNRVDCSVEALDRIRDEAETGYYRLARGGLETGGVLFGTRRGLHVSVFAFRPVECEHALGPSFRLSGRDLERFQAAVDAPAADPDLAGLEAVGWYHSHTRTDLSLSEEDLHVFDRFFPEPGKIALIVRPNHFAPTRAGFFCRDEDGAVETATREFIVLPLLRPGFGRRAAERAPEPPKEAPPQQQPAPDPNPRPFIQPDARARYLPARYPPGTPLPARRAPAPRGRGTASWVWLGVIFCVLLVVAAAAVRRWVLPPPRQPLVMQLKDGEGQLRIEWDRNATPVMLGTGARIDISDGGDRTSVALDTPRLRQGRVVYARRTGKVDIRMRVMRGANQIAEEFAQFAGPEPPPVQARTAVGPGPRLPEGGDLQRQIERIRTELAQQSEEIRKLRETPAVAPPGNAPAAYSGPARGRVIWTGELHRSGTLSIYGAHASSGRVLGQFPGVPVRIRVNPAELSARAMTVYAEDPRDKEPAERPGAQNGFRRTSCVVGRKYAGELAVLEIPSDQNAWRAITVRSQNRGVSAIVISWEIVKN